MSQRKDPAETKSEDTQSENMPKHATWDEEAQEEHLRRRISSRRENIRKRFAEESERRPLEQIEGYNDSNIQEYPSGSENHLANMIRDRVRDKLKAVKAGIASSFTVQESITSAQTLQPLSGKDPVTRFNRTHDTELDEEGSTFFTGTFEDASDSGAEDQMTQLNELSDDHVTGLETARSSTSQRMVKQDKEELEKPIQETGDLSESESKLDLYLSDYLLSDILERVPAAYESRKEREKQTQNLFNPRMSLVPSSSKLPENVEPRYLEEEGFHICHKPYVLKKNLNKMENRLLKQTEVILQL
eukprot:gi/632936378/ref/XP_007894661.1/ PREDICTED: uncharacterized protein C10orf131-like [Callorhinchus milii]